MRSFADSGEHLRKGTAICRRLELPLLDSLPGDEISDEAHLLGHSKDAGMACSDGSKDHRARVSVGNVQRRMGAGRKKIWSGLSLSSTVNVFIVVPGRWPSSGASEWRRWIERLAALHRAAS
jgi:hypothetical protein